MMDASRSLTALAEVSLSTSAVILLLLALGPVLARRYRARWRYWAWLLVAVRLLLPFSLSLPGAPISVEVPDVGSTVVFTPPPTAQVPVSTAPPAAHTMAPGPVLTPPPAKATPAPAPERSPVTLAQVLTLAYLAGLVLFLAWHLIGAVRLSLYCRRWCAPCPDAGAHTALAEAQRRLGLRRCPRVLRCPGLDGPMLAGLFAPALLLPEEGPAPGALPYVFLHELSHYRRRDLWYKLLLLLANALHWFNPLVWLLRRTAGRDLEQSCDELVLRHLNPEERNAYAQAILAAIRKE